jgi:hypothetical protein
MILKIRPEPQTLSELIEASLSEPKTTRRNELQGKFSDLDKVTQLNFMVPTLKTKINKQDHQNIRVLHILIATGIISLVLMGIAAFEKSPIIMPITVVLISTISLYCDSIGRFFPIRAAEGVEGVVDMVKMAKNPKMISSCLDLLAVKTRTSVARSELAALSEALAIPLYRMSDEEVEVLSETQLRTLEMLVFDEREIELTIAGLLVLGNAGHVVQPHKTLRSWAQCPDRRGTAAREYLAALEGRP